MNIYEYHLYWRYSQYNFLGSLQHEHGLIKADSLEDAAKKLKEVNPEMVSCDVCELEFDSDGICTIYSS